MNRFVVAAGILAGFAFGAPAMAQTKPTIPIIVKDTTSVYWQTVLAGARKAGQELGVDVTELGAAPMAMPDSEPSNLRLPARSHARCQLLHGRATSNRGNGC